MGIVRQIARMKAPGAKMRFWRIVRIAFCDIWSRWGSFDRSLDRYATSAVSLATPVPVTLCYPDIGSCKRRSVIQNVPRQKPHDGHLRENFCNGNPLIRYHVAVDIRNSMFSGHRFCCTVIIPAHDNCPGPGLSGAGDHLQAWGTIRDYGRSSGKIPVLSYYFIQETAVFHLAVNAERYRNRHDHFSCSSQSAEIKQENKNPEIFKSLHLSESNEKKVYLVLQI